MGVDWCRAILPRDCDRALLERLIEQQAVAFQSFWGWESQATSDYDPIRPVLYYRLYLDSYLTTSKSLGDLLIFP